MNPEEPLTPAHVSVDLAFPASCWSPERQRVKDWLAQDSPSLSELYEGAVRILFELKPPGYRRFVAHAVREIGNGLEFVIFGIPSRERVDYTNQLDRLVAQWTQAGFATDGTLAGIEPIPNSESPRPIEFRFPLMLARSVSKLVAYHGMPREKPFDRAKKLFTRNKPENERLVNAIRPAVQKFIEVTDWFMEQTHDRRRKEIAAHDDAELIDNFLLFETALGAISRPFFATTDELDKIIEDANS